MRKQQRQLRRVVGRQGQRSGKARGLSRVRRDDRGQAVDEATAQQQAAFGRGQRVKTAAVDKHRSGRAFENGAGQLGGKRICGIEAAADEERQRMTGRHGTKRFRARRRMHRTAQSACAIRARPPVRACGRSLNRGRSASDTPPFIRIKLRVRRQLIPRAHHKRRACRAHRRDGFGRAGNFGIPRAHALRSNRRKTCGAWIVGATGDQRQLAARILVRQVVRPRKQCRHLLQRILLRSLHPSSIRQALRTHMLASSVLQPRKSEVKHGVRHRKQEARRQRANRSTTPSTSATASIVRESQSPQRAPDSPARAGTKTGLRSVNRAEHRASGR